MRADTFRLDQDIDLVALGARSGLLWSRQGFTMAGVGEARRITLEGGTDGSASLLAAQAVLASMVGTDDVNQPGTGPVAFGALSFDPTASSELIVPQIVLGRSTDGRRWITVIGQDGDGTRGGGTLDATLERVEMIAGRAVPAGPEPTRWEMVSALTPEAWRDQVVAVGRDRIIAGDLRKVVLARRIDVRTDHPVDTALVVDRLRQLFPTAILFSIDGFVGASPELLVSRMGDVVRAHPLAGTAARASDPAADAKLSAGLLSSTKDRWEHRITIDWLLDSLLPFCSYVDAEPEPSIVTLANLHHLGTLVEGRLSSPSASVLELVHALHPTPAVGGDPQGLALQLIAQLESTDRGRYGGPAGWVDAAGNGSFAVSVRSGQFGPDGVTVFAGVGVVGDSDPQAELTETRTKFQAMLGALLRP